MYYSDERIDCHENLEPFSYRTQRRVRPRDDARIANKAKSRRVKSAYRDAKFRPIFQAVMALRAAQADGGTSVTYATPSHPLFPLIHLSSSTPSLSIPAEDLTDEEEIRAARFWRSFNATMPRKHRLPGIWRDVSDQTALEWFHHAMRVSGPLCAFGLNLSPEVEAQARIEPNAAKWLSARISRRLKHALGRKVDFWFVFEVSDTRRLHIHGELGISVEEGEAARKALRLAGGEWEHVRQHQTKTKADPSAVWTGYCAKNAIFIRPLTGRLSNLPRPINGEWFFSTNTIRREADVLYTTCRREVLNFINEQNCKSC